jgi:hypothetical protein
LINISASNKFWVLAALTLSCPLLGREVGAELGVLFNLSLEGKIGSGLDSWAGVEDGFALNTNLSRIRNVE